MSTQQKPDTIEIDLIALSKQLWQFLLKNALLIVLGAVVGAGAGYGYFRLKDKEYRSTMVATAYALEDSRIIELFDDINQLLTDGDNKTTAKLLNISPEQAKGINEFGITSAYELEKQAKKLNDDKMELRPSTTFKVSVSVKDTTLFKVAEQAVLHYLGENAFSLEQIKTDQEAMTAEVQALEERIRRMDSLSIIAHRQSGTSTIGMRSPDAEAAELFIRINNLKKELLRLEPIRVIKPFTVFKKARWPKLSIFVLVGALAGMGVALTLGTFRK